MAKGSGLMKKLEPSEALAEVLGSDKPVSRAQAVKGIWAYIKKHKLQDEDKKRIINPDDVLAGVLGTKSLDMLKMGGKLSAHLS